MSNRFEGGVSEDQMKVFIAETLEEVPPDILKLLYRIAFFSQSGLE